MFFKKKLVKKNLCPSSQQYLKVEVSFMASQQSIKLCWILYCSTTNLLGLAGQDSGKTFPKRSWG
jgi:hypothetical protein